jgi:hypothetical protein
VPWEALAGDTSQASKEATGPDGHHLLSLPEPLCPIPASSRPAELSAAYVKAGLLQKQRFSRCLVGQARVWCFPCVCFLSSLVRSWGAWGGGAYIFPVLGPWGLSKSTQWRMWLRIPQVEKSKISCCMVLTKFFLLLQTHRAIW